MNNSPNLPQTQIYIPMNGLNIIAEYLKVAKEDK